MRVGPDKFPRWVLDTGSVFAYFNYFLGQVVPSVYINHRIIYHGASGLVTSCTKCDLTPRLGPIREYCLVTQLALDPAVYAELELYKWTSVSPHAIKGLDDLYDELY